MSESGEVRRNSLPNRRQHEVYRFESQGQTYIGGVGRYGDGSIAELFLNATKAGSTIEAMAQDAAIVASLALQFGCPSMCCVTRSSALATQQDRWRPSWMRYPVPTRPR